jgi:hypothetical protein
VPSSLGTRRTGAADRWINYAAATTVAGLAGIAGALSYSHMRQLAQDHGQAGWPAHAFPLSVDGIEIVASLVLLADRRAGRRSGWLPWTALALGTAGSLAANIATAHPDPVSRIIAGWPALALLLAVKLLSGILEHREVPERGSVRASEPALAPNPGQPDPAVTTVASKAVGDQPTSQPRPPGRAAEETTATGKPSDITGLPPAIAALLPAARLARDELHCAGHSLTRDALAAHLRRHGHPIRNSGLTPLLNSLRYESGSAITYDKEPASRVA